MSRKEDLVGRLEVVPIRKVFSKEAQDFTPWLEEHIEVLAERLNLQLTVVQREKEVGNFTLDLLCEDAQSRPVIIENQLEKTDHAHLGQLLTYVVNLGGNTAIWITSDPQPEHKAVMEWLNESTPADVAFYLVKVEAIRIGDSPYAPLFTVIVGPDVHTKEVGEGKKEWAERHVQRHAFWTALLEKCKQRTKLFANISPSRDYWISASAGRSGLSFNFVVRRESASVELYIDHDKETGAGNKATFDALYRQREAIEKEFGGPLEWERLDDARASRIKKTFYEGGWSNRESWESLHEKMVTAMIAFHKALSRRLPQALQSVQQTDARHEE